MIFEQISQKRKKSTSISLEQKWFPKSDPIWIEASPVMNFVFNWKIGNKLKLEKFLRAFERQFVAEKS